MQEDDKTLTDISELKFYATRDHDCGYLPNQQAKTIFVDPNAPIDAELYSELSEFGFRRSGPHIYRPHCDDCNACIPIRISAREFTPNKSQKRCLKRNADLSKRIIESIDTDEHYALYERYINERHADGDMYPPTRAQYADFLTKEWNVTQYIEYRYNDQLLAVSVVDRLENGLSAIYAFFDPQEHKRSLGVFNVLDQLQRAKAKGLPFLYLGYWIKECQKMRYKVDYRPFQVFVENQWMTVRDYPSNSKSA